MKKLLIGLLVLISTFANGQKIDFDTLAGKSWVKSYFQSEIKKLGNTTPVDPIKPVDPVDPVVPSLDPCKEGPIIKSIFDVTTTGLRFQFHGVDVRGIEYEVKNSNGVRVSFGVLTPTSNILPVSYPGQVPGEYTLYIQGSTCKSNISSVSFTVKSAAVVVPPVIVPPVNNGERLIYMNTTGFGFDPNAVTGIDKDWVPRIEAFTNLVYNGVKFSGIDGVRLAVKWSDYEPKEGQFRSDDLKRAIKYLTDRNLRVSICFLPFRSMKDGMIPDSDILIGSNGDIAVVDADKYTISPNSTIGKNKLANAVRNLTKTILETGAKVDYFSLGYGQSEEFYLPAYKDPKTHQVKYNTGFNTVDKQAWNAWLDARGYARIGIPVPWDFSNAFWAGEVWNGSDGRKWYNFMTDSLADLYHTFRDAVHSQNGKVCGYFAGAGDAQGAWFMVYHLERIFDGCDYIYSSDGGQRINRADKLLAADFMAGTFPNSKAVMEFDPEDVGIDGQYLNNPYGMPLDWNAFYSYSKSLFAREVKMVTFAMAFSGETGYSNGVPFINNIATSAEVLWKLRKECIEQDVEQLPVSSVIDQKVDNYMGDQPYRRAWYDAGGGLNKRILINTNVEASTPARFESFNVGGIGGEVWLPKNYSASKKYAVIYAPDRVTLFAKDNHSDGNWDFDNRTQALIDAGQIKDCIVVGIDYPDRMRTLLPNKPFYAMPSKDQTTISTPAGGAPLGDETLAWIVGSLKPYIDSHYSTYTDRANTVLLGASMGGLFALYGFGEKPNIFGKIASVSTHYQGTLHSPEQQLMTDEVLAYVKSTYQNPDGVSKLYFDRGTTSLDENYAAAQDQLKIILEGKGYNTTNSKFVVAVGAEHKPSSWGLRLPEILKFLIPR